MIEAACLFQTRCLRDNKVIRAPKGTTIFMPEQRTSYVYHLHEGVVGFFQIDIDGREIVTTLTVPPLLIGFAGFAGMDSKRHILHITEARTVTQVVYCRTQREAVWDLMDDRQARAQIMELICGTALLTGRVSGSAIAGDIEPRILTILDVLGQSVGTHDALGRIVITGITHDDVAAMAKVTRPTMSRALEKLQERGVIKIARRCIVLIKPDVLRLNRWF